MLGSKFMAGAVALAAGLVLAGSSQAKVQWTITGGTFDDGGTFSGSFDISPGKDKVLDWNITTSPSSVNPVLGVTYAPFYTIFPIAVSSGTASDAGGWPKFDQNTLVSLGGPPLDFQDELQLTNVPFSSPGGVTVSPLTGQETDAACNPVFGCGTPAVRTITDGTAAAVAVPEPASWAMLLLGVGAIGAVARRRRTTAVA
jgi:hypothetical protein